MDSVLIIGSEGQLGRCLTDVLKTTYELTALSRRELDLSKPEGIGSFLSEKNYIAVINCAAYTAVDRAEKEPEAAQLINTTAVGKLAEACAEYNIPFIHFSSDYVYDNGVERPLVEGDLLNPRSVYARTKLAGERAALIAHEKTFIIRTSWVFSEYGHNFVKTMLSLAAKGINPKVVEDQKGCPTYARDLAGVVAVLLTKIEELEPGVYNFCNAGETTWFGFARAIYKAAGLKVDVAPITTAEFGALAPRPSYSVLDTTLIHEKTGVVPRKWNVALQDCIARLSDIMSNDN